MMVDTFILTKKIYVALFKTDVINFIADNVILNEYGRFIPATETISHGSEFKCLNYYNFNILLNLTKEQKTIFHNLNDNFFEELSTHKNKLFFLGRLYNEKTLFKLEKIIYLISPKKMGILVRKKILSKMSEFGIILNLDTEWKNSNTVTYFKIKN